MDFRHAAVAAARANFLSGLGRLCLGLEGKKVANGFRHALGAGVAECRFADSHRRRERASAQARNLFNRELPIAIRVVAMRDSQVPP